MDDRYKCQMLLIRFHITYHILLDSQYDRIGNNNLIMIKGKYQLVKGFENNTLTVGFGSYGQVKLGKNVETGQTVAIKIINKLAKNEVVCHNRLSHPKIIELLSYYVDREKEKTYMVLEYMDDGTLFQKVRVNELSKHLIRKYFRDVCQAIAYLHSKEIMHRDIKPENILLNKKKQAKLCDFGFAAILGERMTLCGTYQYMSPQMIQNKPYDQKIDIWALGILLFEMIAGHAPFRGQSPHEVLSEMKTKIFFNQKFTAEQIALIKMILRVTPCKRPTIQQILSHPYFEDSSNSTRASEQDNQIKIISMQRLQKQITNQNSSLNSFYKSTQSYPFYMPKVNATSKIEYGRVKQYQNMTINSSKYIKSNHSNTQIASHHLFKTPNKKFV